MAIDLEGKFPLEQLASYQLLDGDSMMVSSVF